MAAGFLRPRWPSSDEYSITPLPGDSFPFHLACSDWHAALSEFDHSADDNTAFDLVVSKFIALQQESFCVALTSTCAGHPGTETFFQFRTPILPLLVDRRWILVGRFDAQIPNAL